MTVRMLCRECAEEYKESFALQPIIRREVRKACELCGKRKGCLLYEAERKRENDARD